MARSAAHFIPLDQIAIVHVSDHLLYPSALDSFVQRKEMTGVAVSRILGGKTILEDQLLSTFPRTTSRSDTDNCSPRLEEPQKHTMANVVNCSQQSEGIDSRVRDTQHMR